MKREEKIRAIKSLLNKVGIIPLINNLSLSCGKVDIIQGDGVYLDSCGDWVLKGTYSDCKYCPTLTDKDVDNVYWACMDWARKVASGELEDED